MPSSENDELAAQRRLDREREAELERSGMRGWIEVGSFLDSPETPDIRAELTAGTRIRVAEAGSFGQPGGWYSLYCLAVEKNEPDRWNMENVWIPQERSLILKYDGEPPKVGYLFDKEYHVEELSTKASPMLALEVNGFLDQVAETQPKEPGHRDIGNMIAVVEFHLRSQEEKPPIES